MPAFVALARNAASLNGYTPEQSSALLHLDGTQDDWAYHEQHIFSLTFEMGPGGEINFYPAADKIAKLTTVNKGAVLYCSPRPTAHIALPASPPTTAARRQPRSPP
jgi:hypothetical protein